MENRANSLSFQAKNLEVCREMELMKDHISKLPNDIIVSILSLLTMKEAGRTSVLSKRYRYVWAYIPILNFDGTSALYRLMSDETPLDVEKPRYLRWVNQVVRSYRGPTIDEFRVNFDLGVTSRYYIDNWFRFVMEKRVKRLQFDLSNLNGGQRDACYTLRGLPRCNSLTSLTLLSVNVTGKFLQNFLKSCPNLVYLKVHDSKSLVNLEVDGEILNLNHLEICFCSKIKHIEICAPNLVSFKYFGPRINMPYKTIPKLAKLSIGGDYNKHLVNNLSEVTSHLFQLEALSLEFTYGLKFFKIYVDEFPLFTKLKQLDLVVDPAEDEELFCFAPLIKACPFLHKFVLTFKWNTLRTIMKQQEVEACPHHHLKIMEILGFIGNKIDSEFITYLIESCVALEKITIDPREPCFNGTPFEFEPEVIKRKRKSQKQAKKLRKKLKPKADFIIL